jgi:hypothetical protein
MVNAGAGTDFSLRALNDSRLTLKEFNNFSAQTLGAVSADFAKHTKVIRSIKADLDYIFKHTRYEVETGPTPVSKVRAGCNADERSDVSSATVIMPHVRHLTLT